MGHIYWPQPSPPPPPTSPPSLFLRAKPRNYSADVQNTCEPKPPRYLYGFWYVM